MRVIYAGIDLMPVKTHEFSLQAVYDDSLTDYLFSRGTIIVEAIISINPATIATGSFMSYVLTSPNFTPGSTAPNSRVDRIGANSFIPINAPPGSPIPRAGFEDIGTTAGFASSPQGPITRINPTAASITHTAIRHILETPRQQLYLYSGNGMAEADIAAGSTASPTTWGAVVLAQAPAAEGLLCDVNNGPKPHVFSIKEALGDANTFVVVWGCEFFINEALQNNLAPIGALLSNRFNQTHHVDEHGWTTIVTEGKAIFRTDVLYNGSGNGADFGEGADIDVVGAIPNAIPSVTFGTPISPDTLRAGLFLPIQQGFKRTIDYVRGLEDVTGVEYGYTDTQVPVNFVAGPFANPSMPGTGAASISVLHRQAIVSNNQDILGGALEAFERYAGLQANRNIAKDKPKKPEEPEKPKKRKKPAMNMKKLGSSSAS